jgi:polyisoprenoid-binding protein YceI
MRRYGPSDAEITARAYREGVLSAVGHDVEVEAGSFRVDVDAEAGTVEAFVDAGSVRVRGALRDGRVDPSLLSASDARTIDQNLRDEVLEARRYPEIRFVGRVRETTADGREIEGTLHLHGMARPIRLRTRRRGDVEETEVRLSQPDFGIRPFRALMGALKVRPEVTVRVVLRGQGSPPSS